MEQKDKMVMVFPDMLSSFEILRRQSCLPGASVVARLQLHDPDALFQSPRHNFTLPFDRRLGEMLIRTVTFLFGRHPSLYYAYLERDEFSLIFSPPLANSSATALLLRLNAEASARLSLQLEEVVLFTSHLYQFISQDQIVSYLAWRQECFAATALDSYCYWVLMRNGADAPGARAILEGLGAEDKVEILAQNDLNYHDVPAWQQAGTSIQRDRSREGKVKMDTNLPVREAYEAYLRELL